ncbi:MAG: hypothetical protein IJ087_14805 [Eggerthellaceae bacterium]|nr:hypothetical protein [Eggerthellaceae bacterium]
MAGKDKAAQTAGADVMEVEQDGIAVQVDMTYLRSWPGIRQAARMQSPDRDEAERLVAMVAYYERAIPNIDDVSDALGESAPANEVLGFLARAVRSATPKN